MVTRSLADPSALRMQFTHILMHFMLDLNILLHLYTARSNLWAVSFAGRMVRVLTEATWTILHPISIHFPFLKLQYSLHSCIYNYKLKTNSTQYIMDSKCTTCRACFSLLLICVRVTVKTLKGIVCHSIKTVKIGVEIILHWYYFTKFFLSK